MFGCDTQTVLRYRAMLAAGLDERLEINLQFVGKVCFPDGKVRKLGTTPVVHVEGDTFALLYEPLPYENKYGKYVTSVDGRWECVKIIKQVKGTEERWMWRRHLEIRN